ncbi:DUF2207 domain-containing protein [Leptotrichia sp. oral taxon 212]|uniref:DUF2207 domain-containing protein n=1 Tax=Leptotrichia sp. oral taxon 212 TaxID=712357 RepID=UPI0006A97C0A|nr:DUF2207 domain-containing protein [Leptotrichia sp. oral taxon 212]ALA96103.1 transmembrane signal peptide protein [Leptotrichia sp. oral taxon 212]
MKKQRQKKFLTTLSVIFMVFLLNAGSLIAEAIKKYDVSIQINKNGTLTVNEVIDYEFDNDLRHGIYRDIPLRSKKSGTDIYKSHVKMNSVKRNGEPENYTSDTSYEGVSYRVGSADRYVDSGINKYEFNYTIYNAVFEKDGIYQVYFNPIGQFWNVPIESADVSISFENNEPVGENEVQQLEVYTGEYGETGKNYTIVQESGIIKIKTNEVLEPRNGLSFRLNLKTDKISPTWLDKLEVLYYADPLVIAGPVIILMLAIYGFVTWFLFGKDPSGKAVIPEFNIPKDISPMYAAYIKGVRDPKEMLTIGMLSLLSKDYVTAEDKEGNGKNVKYSLVKNTERNPELSSEEKALLCVLSDDEKNIFKNEQGLYDAAKKILGTLETRYNKKIYIDNNLFKYPFILGIIMVFIIGMGIQNIAGSIIDGMGFIIPIIIIFFSSLTIVLSILKRAFSQNTLLSMLIRLMVVMCLGIMTQMTGFIITVIIFIMYSIYSKLIGKYTNEGIRHKEYLEGMKMYIKTAEANQIMKFNDVDELVGYFKGILPYAVALGVKNEAIKLMQKTIKLYNFDENTYYDINRRVYYDSYNSRFLSNAISRGYNNAYDKIMEDRFKDLKSAGGGSGGFGGGGFSSGGGFSGGGSGGGGGGSW